MEKEHLPFDQISDHKGDPTVKEFILPPKGLFAVLVITALIAVVQFGIAATTQAWTKVDEGPCTFKSWSQNGFVHLNLDCNGAEAWTDDAEVILGYIAKPGPLNCSLWASGKASCEVPK